MFFAINFVYSNDEDYLNSSFEIYIQQYSLLGGGEPDDEGAWAWCRWHQKLGWRSATVSAIPRRGSWRFDDERSKKIYTWLKHWLEIMKSVKLSSGCLWKWTDGIVRKQIKLWHFVIFWPDTWEFRFVPGMNGWPLFKPSKFWNAGMSVVKTVPPRWQNCGGHYPAGVFRPTKYSPRGSRRTRVLIRKITPRLSFWQENQHGRRSRWFSCLSQVIHNCAIVWWLLPTLHPPQEFLLTRVVSTTQLPILSRTLDIRLNHFLHIHPDQARHHILDIHM